LTSASVTARSKCSGQSWAIDGASAACSPEGLDGRAGQVEPRVHDRRCRGVDVQRGVALERRGRPVDLGRRSGLDADEGGRLADRA
jgi:hypothetical protein